MQYLNFNVREALIRWGSKRDLHSEILLNIQVINFIVGMHLPTPCILIYSNTMDAASLREFPNKSMKNKSMELL